jgi:putative sigma-54 modulation protein
MKITFSARHFEASANLQEFATGEIRRLKKYFDGILHAEVVLEEHSTNKLVEIRVNMLGKTLTSKIEDSDFYKIIPKAVDKLEKQIKTTKSKVMSR